MRYLTGCVSTCFAVGRWIGADFLVFFSQVKLKEGPPVLYGKSPNDLPNYELDVYTTGAGTIVGCSTGPNGGLTTVKRVEKHLDITDADIDYIDTQDESNGES